MDNEPCTSLLSLSLAAAAATPANTAPAPTTGRQHHRRLSSMGKSRRRLSDAKEASQRAAVVSSLNSLTLSTSTSPSPAAHKPLAPRPAQPSAEDESMEPTAAGAIAISKPGLGKKRGIDYRCESCAKVYRHPNCLNKHRWEHTRQWREASKFVLSKHQQVQLLEAATILSYMGSKASTSLPDDRSEWPSFLSGGALPKCGPNGEEFDEEDELTTATSGLAGNGNQAGTARSSHIIAGPAPHPHPVSASVPVGGPRMHDYALSSSTGVTQLRPGLLAVPTATSGSHTEIGAGSGSPKINTAKPTAPMSVHRHHSSSSADYQGGYYPSTFGSYYQYPTPGYGSASGTGGWSLPSSSLRSESGSAPSLSLSISRSRSGSGSRGRRSDEDDDDLEDMDEDHDFSRGIPVRVRVRGEDDGDSLVDMDGDQGGIMVGSDKTVGILSSAMRTTRLGRKIHTRTSSDGAESYGFGYARRRGLNKDDEETSMPMGVGRKIVEDEREGKWNGMEMDLDMDMD